MTESNYRLERFGTGLILFIGLLMFLAPLVRLRGPSGDVLGDGYHVLAGMTQLRSSLAVVATIKPTEDRGGSNRSETKLPTVAETPEIPFSLRTASLTPWLIYLAMACACFALLDLVSFRRAVARLSLAGGCCGTLAILHVIWMGSDLRSWTAELMRSGLLNSGDNVIVVTRLLVINSFQVNPGPGLLVLTTCLLLVPFISFTRAIPRIRSVVRSEPRIQVSQPVRVRPLNSNYPAETCTSLDLSRSGLCVESACNDYYVGMEVYVTRNAHQGGVVNSEEHGSVVRVEELEDGKCRFAIRVLSGVKQPAATPGGSARPRREDQVAPLAEITANSR